jgi:hypothetical protein
MRHRAISNGLEMPFQKSRCFGDRIEGLHLTID